MASGAKFSQVGADISRASDQEMLFDSEWPTMHILQGGFIEDTVTGFQIFYAHNLGFIPAFIPYVYDESSGQFEIFRALLYVDETNIYAALGGGSGTPVNVKYGILIFNIDIEKPYEAPSNNPSASVQGGSTNAYGIRIVKDGKSMKSKSMQDYKVNTSARAPLVHAVSYGAAQLTGPTSGTRNYAYTHSLPYNPMFLTYVELLINGTRVFANISNFAGVSTRGNTITVLGMTPGYHASIIVLKDPFDVSQNITEVSI